MKAESIQLEIDFGSLLYIKLRNPQVVKLVIYKISFAIIS